MSPRKTGTLLFFLKYPDPEPIRLKTDALRRYQTGGGDGEKENYFWLTNQQTKQGGKITL